LKLRVEISSGEEEILIRCKSVDDKILRLQNTVSLLYGGSSELSFFLGDTEYFIAVQDILFFETQGKKVSAHTSDGMYYTDRKLYELMTVLPDFFVRVSKSCIVNAFKICAIDKNITGASTAHFKGCPKVAYISRMYYSELRNIIKEMRFMQ